MTKDINKMLKAVNAEFIRFCKHGSLWLVNGTRVQVAGTPSDYRAIRNIRRDLLGSRSVRPREI